MATASLVANAHPGNPAPATILHSSTTISSNSKSSKPPQTRNLVPVTLVDADLLHATDTDSATPPSRPRIQTWINLRLKLLQTRVNGRLSLWYLRLPQCMRRRLDKRRAAKWADHDMSVWNDTTESSNDYWANLGTPHQLSDTTAPAPTNADGPPASLPIRSHRMGSFMGGGLAGNGLAPPPHAFDEHYKAYSVAMFPRAERENVSYGGKILMPPSALARLSQLNFPSPWMFQLRNPKNAAASTHAGVLEFIADEGCVFLPHWMMKTLKLNEADPIRITGASLPKGKFVKLQAQETSFVEVSDPKAHYIRAIGYGDTNDKSKWARIIAICHSSTGPGIAVFDTDLEVDFATPKGWKEPVRAPPKPIETMATRLGLDGGKTASGKSTPSGSRPGSSLGAVVDDDAFEAFKGRGETLNGRKTKGKGVRTGGRKITEVDASSKIERTDKPKLITSSMLDMASSATATDAQPLNLEFGQLFFGYPVVPYKPPAQTQKEKTEGEPSTSGIGLSVLDSLRGGNTLSGRPTPRSSTPAPTGSERGGAATPDVPGTTAGAGYAWGAGGHALGSVRIGSSASASKAGSARGDGEKKKKRKKPESIDVD
ncbi:SubName: Full=Related to UFD1-ubiquitin fusion degradation protein {ECO:0000313/EMBL:CCA73171.1} [Serendipita indica DSM 11827]|nr:SubName: Full=Related to UFD1-ubiquitin fusion degradation protein {ECO:0000313/EMBL:CCA73171.1} [Serendipita indica DSM 11827]